MVGRGRTRERSTVRVHESTQLHLADATEVDGVPVTGVARTVLDVAAVSGPKKIEWTIDAVLRQNLLAWPDLYQVLVRHARRGRDGAGKLRAVLDERFGNDPIPDSKWNRMVEQLLEDHGLPTASLEYNVHHKGAWLARVDLAFPEHLLAIELDSVRYHLNRTSFEADPRRKNRLMVAGWQVLTFTWADYNDRPLELVSTIRRALRSAKLRASAATINA